MKYTSFASVVVDTSIHKLLDYGIPPSLQNSIQWGMRVSIPIRGKLHKGTIIEIKNHSFVKNLQPIHDLLSEESILTQDLLDLAHWMSRYYATPLTRVFKSLLPATLRKDQKAKQQYQITRTLSLPKTAEYAASIRKSRPKQATVLDHLLNKPKGILLSELTENSEISASAIQTLIKNQILQKQLVDIDRVGSEEFTFFPTEPKTLSLEQNAALQSIQNSLEDNTFQTHLLWGITGSGKTEVYLQAMQHALTQKKGVLMLVPEVALTTQMIERIKGRFQEKIAILHHRISPGERTDAYRALRRGEIHLCIGARSAIFSPLPNLGLIIVDEEHESSYKQTEEMPCYHARDIAIMRGKFNQATVVLGSATPSIESYYNATNDKYHLSVLTHRPQDTQRPHISVVDMQHEKENHKMIPLFSDVLLKKLKEKIALGEQTILFLNRRGYYACQICEHCNNAIQCNHCDVPLTFHKSQKVLSCHLCGYAIPSDVQECAHCHSKDTFTYKGRGTEQVQKALHAIFPEIRTLRMDRDTTRHQGSFAKIYTQFRSQKADVLIGTQMVAKGFDFPNVTLVGILQADATLHIPDFRSDEMVFSLITQVAGRSGRGALPGEVLIQTFLPQHPTIVAATKEDYPTFFQEALGERKEFGFPPFTRLAKVVITGYDSHKTQSFAEHYRKQLITQLPPDFVVHPIIPCGYAKIKDRFRFQCIIKGKAMHQLGPRIHQMAIPIPRHMTVLIDVDPTSTYS